MTTINWMDRLSEYLDDALTPDERSACEAWLASNTEGQVLLQELRRVVAKAKTLANAAVPESVWVGVSAGIRSSTSKDVAVLPLEPFRLAASSSRRWQLSSLQLAAAAVVLLAVGVGSGLKLRTGSGIQFANGPRGGSGVTTGVKVTPVLARRADASYDKAVQELQIVLDQNRSTMDTATVRVLESSLARIDAALDEAERALQSDPHSAYLNDHLSRIKRKKLDLLRQGASLVQAS